MQHIQSMNNEITFFSGMWQPYVEMSVRTNTKILIYKVLVLTLLLCTLNVKKCRCPVGVVLKAHKLL